VVVAAYPLLASPTTAAAEAHLDVVLCNSGQTNSSGQRFERELMFNADMDSIKINLPFRFRNMI